MRLVNKGGVRGTHHLCHLKAYATWAQMRQRCLNPRAQHYARYGGRGITICERWQTSFENFLEDMGERPPGMTLDRIDNDGGYCKENCRWASKREQATNRCDTKMLTIRGETMCVKDWARTSGITYEGIRGRLRRGFSAEDAVFAPLHSLPRRPNLGRWKGHVKRHLARPHRPCRPDEAQDGRHGGKASLPKSDP